MVLNGRFHLNTIRSSLYILLLKHSFMVCVSTTTKVLRLSVFQMLSQQSLLHSQLPRRHLGLPAIHRLGVEIGLRKLVTGGILQNRLKACHHDSNIATWPQHQGFALADLPPAYSPFKLEPVLLKTTLRTPPPGSTLETGYVISSHCRRYC